MQGHPRRRPRRAPPVHGDRLRVRPPRGGPLPQLRRRQLQGGAVRIQQVRLLHREDVLHHELQGAPRAPGLPVPGKIKNKISLLFGGAI